MDINKPHRKKIYQNTSNYNKLFNILKEFQQKLGPPSLEVKTHSVKTWRVLRMYMFICIYLYKYIPCICLFVCTCINIYQVFSSVCAWGGGGGVFPLVLKQTIRNTLVCGFLFTLSQWHLIVKMGWAEAVGNWMAEITELRNAREYSIGVPRDKLTMAVALFVFSIAVMSRDILKEMPAKSQMPCVIS